MHYVRYSLTIRPRLKAARRGGIWLRAVVVLAILGIGGLVAASYYRRDTTVVVDKPLTREVEVGAFEHVVVEQGEIESSSNVEIRCEVKSRGSSGMTILQVVPEGTLVAEGDLLVKLDSTALDQELIQQQIACNTAEATMIQSQNTFEAAKIAKIEYLEGTFKQEERLILGEIFVAEQNLRTAQLAFSSAERLSARGIVTSLQLEGDQFAVEKARNELTTAQSKLEVLRKYTKEKMLKQLESDIASAEAKWNADKKTLELEQTKLRDIEDQIAKCSLKAPRAGQVVYANKYSQGRSGSSAEFVVEPGAVVREQQPIIRLPDPGQMQVRTLINESRINFVRPGMPATIRVDALREDVLLGEVMKVNQYAEPGGWSSGNVKKYAALVKIKDPPSSLRTSMNSEVRIYVERQPEALQVPLQAVAEYKNKFFCLVENGETYVTREIDKGPANDKFMVVLKGLKSGDHVVLNPRSRPELQFPNLPDPEPIAQKIEAPLATVPVSTTAGPGGEGKTAGGKGGRGNMNPASMVAQALDEFDTNKDGKLQKDEVAAITDERRRGRMAEADTNHDGDIDRNELTVAMTKVVQMIRARMEAGGGGGPPGGGPGS